MKTVTKALAKLSLVLALTSPVLVLTGCQTAGPGAATGSESADSLRAAANNGNADAALKLGDMYYHGRGVSKNNADAERWYIKAAELYQRR